MTGSEMAKYLGGQQATITLGDLTFQVTTHDAKPRFGQVSVLVRPRNGSGEQWLDSARVRLGLWPVIDSELINS